MVVPLQLCEILKVDGHQFPPTGAGWSFAGRGFGGGENSHFSAKVKLPDESCAFETSMFLK
jgi:hypothetical protein